LATVEYGQAIPGSSGDTVISVTNPNDVSLTFAGAADNGSPIQVDDSTACPVTNIAKAAPAAVSEGRCRFEQRTLGVRGMPVESA
jgi:hypothetical protein